MSFFTILVPLYKDDGTLTILKVGSFLLLLALAIMSIMLLYFVKKKVLITYQHIYMHIQ